MHDRVNKFLWKKNNKQTEKQTKKQTDALVCVYHLLKEAVKLVTQTDQVQAYSLHICVTTNTKEHLAACTVL